MCGSVSRTLFTGVEGHENSGIAFRDDHSGDRVDGPNGHRRQQSLIGA